MKGVFTMKAGGYELHPQVGEQELAVFNYAMKGYVGMHFEPVAVASQVVNGTNYIFVCTGKPVVLHPETKLYAVRIFTKFAHSVAPTVDIKAIEEIDIANLISK